MTEQFAKAAFVEFGEALGALYKEMLLDRLIDVSGGEDRLQKKLATYLEAKGMEIEDFISQYREHIVVYVSDDMITVAADSEEWDFLVQVLEYGTRLSPPMPHWMSSARDFYTVNKSKIDNILQEGMEAAQKKILTGVQ